MSGISIFILFFLSILESTSSCHYSLSGCSINSQSNKYVIPSKLRQNNIYSICVAVFDKYIKSYNTDKCVGSRSV